MRLINKSIYALALASMMGLWSCSQDEALPGGQTTAKGHPVPVTLTVSRGEAQTRTFLSENEDGSLTDIWKEGDELQVYSGDGKTYHGAIQIKEGQETSVGVFSGVLDNVTDGTADYYLWYVNGSNERIESAKDSYNVYIYNVNYNNQGYKTIGELSAMDLLNQKITLKVSGTNATVTQNYTMEAKLPLVHFTLGGDLTGETGDLRIFDDNRSLKCPVTSGYMRVTSMNGKEPRPGGHDDEENYLTAKVTDGEVYLAMSPSYSEGTKVQLRFEFDKDGKTYTYQFNNKTELKAGSYYSAVLDMQTEEEPEVVDHTKNPLAKWAESDLKRSGSGASATGVFTGNYKTTGAYYQFGRNYGHQSVANVLANYSKMGVAKMNSNWTGGYFNTTEYGRVDATNLKNVYLGDGSTNTAKWYTSTTNLASYPEYFLFAGNSSLGNWSGELVFDTSIRKTHSWAQRAKYYGYTKELCPEGYKIPTLADWAKILPKGGHEYTGSTFATFSELKEDGDVKYAVRWSRVLEGSTQYLKIDALVVPSSVENTNSIDWTDANVVTRHFKAAGTIKPGFYLGQLTVWDPYNYRYVTSYQWVARPMPQCSFEFKTIALNDTQAVVGINVTRDDNWLSGYYWVDDPNQYYMEFRFDANNLQQQGSHINCYAPEVPIACNIRCIKKD